MSEIPKDHIENPQPPRELADILDEHLDTINSLREGMSDSETSIHTLNSVALAAYGLLREIVRIRQEELPQVADEVIKLYGSRERLSTVVENMDYLATTEEFKDVLNKDQNTTIIILQRLGTRMQDVGDILGITRGATYQRIRRFKNLS